MSKVNLILKIGLLLLIIPLLTGFVIAPNEVNLFAESPVVRAVLFYSPSCGHCQMVITEVLPPLIEKYSDQLLIIGIDVSEATGQSIYQLAIEHYEIPQERLGVPTLLVGEQYLVGSREIPEIFPILIEEGLQAGGVSWPGIPELISIINEQEIEQNTVEETEEVLSEVNNQSTIEPATTIEENSTVFQSIMDRFSRDITGNTISTVVLVGMIIAVAVSAYRFLGNNEILPKRWHHISIIVLTIIGLGVAFYLAFVEVSQTEAVCGPVGDCNTVQTSRFAQLFGIIPVGIMGVVGYFGILLLEIIRFFSPNWKIRAYSILFIWGIAIFGTLFSIYLTFLEPFVIGATCVWCVSSAIIMTAILVISTPSAKYVFEEMDEEETMLDPELMEYK